MKIILPTIHVLRWGKHAGTLKLFRDYYIFPMLTRKSSTTLGLFQFNIMNLKISTTPVYLYYIIRRCWFLKDMYYWTVAIYFKNDTRACRYFILFNGFRRVGQAESRTHVGSYHTPLATSNNQSSWSLFSWSFHLTKITKNCKS